MASSLNQQVKTGYRYVEPTRRDDTANNIRNLGLLNSAILRLLLDCALFIAAKKNPAQTNRLLSVQIADEQAVSAFFYEHVQKDIRVFVRCFG